MNSPKTRPTCYKMPSRTRLRIRVGIARMWCGKQLKGGKALKILVPIAGFAVVTIIVWSAVPTTSPVVIDTTPTVAEHPYHRHQRHVARQRQNNWSTLSTKVTNQNMQRRRLRQNIAPPVQTVSLATDILQLA